MGVPTGVTAVCKSSVCGVVPLMAAAPREALLVTVRPMCVVKMSSIYKRYKRSPDLLVTERDRVQMTT